MTYTTQEMRAELAELEQIFDDALFDKWISRQDSLDIELDPAVVSEQRTHFTATLFHRDQAHKVRSQLTELDAGMASARQQVDNYEEYKDKHGTNLQSFYQTKAQTLEQFERCRVLMLAAVEFHATMFRHHNGQLMEPLQKFLNDNNASYV